MTNSRRIVPTILLLVAVLCFSPVWATAATPAGSGGVTSTGTTGTTSGTDTAVEAPVTLSQEQIQAMQDAANGQNGNRSFIEKSADFVTEKAPFFIIGIIVLAAIIAGIMILRGRPGSAGSGPGAAERRRRKRLETQRARQEERLRRQARRTGVPLSAAGTSAAWSDPGRAAIDAEKAGATRARPAPAPVRSQGAVAAPYSPSQTAPAPGVITAPAAARAASGPADVPTANLPLPGPDVPGGHGLPDSEPSLEAPGADATVGRKAAAFAAAGGMSVADHIHRDAPEPASRTGLSPEGYAEIPPAADEVAGAPGPVIDDRLRATLDDLGGTHRGPVSPAPSPGSGNSGADEGLSVGLAAVERRLSEEREERDRALSEAEDRLRRVEQRAEDAERRAAFAERLTRLKLEEADRDQRLRDVIDGIERAEQRAEDAESRARAAEISAAAALEQPSAPIRSEPPARSQPPVPPRPPARPPQEQRDEPASTPDPGRRVEPEAAPEEEADPAPRTPEKAAPEGGGLASRRPGPENGKRGGALNLNQATFEQLRSLGLSVTQATRILAYRERFGGYSSLDDLDRVPGFSPEKIESMRSGFTV